VQTPFAHKTEAEMNLLPLLFIPELAGDCANGHKTMTRRLRGLTEINHHPSQWNFDGFTEKDGQLFAEFSNLAAPDELKKTVRSPYGMAGDYLWVRESFVYRDKHNKYYFKADYPTHAPYAHGGWKPNLHLPLSGCRTFLQLQSIHVERLQQISATDAEREGAKVRTGIGRRLVFLPGENGAMDFLPKQKDIWTDDELIIAHFAELWCKINSRKSWEANPWLWVLSFTKVLPEENRNLLHLINYKLENQKTVAA
jgi:hypothetical protein